MAYITVHVHTVCLMVWTRKKILGPQNSLKGIVPYMDRSLPTRPNLIVAPPPNSTIG